MRSRAMKTGTASLFLLAALVLVGCGDAGGDGADDSTPAATGTPAPPPGETNATPAPPPVETAATPLAGPPAPLAPGAFNLPPATPVQQPVRPDAAIPDATGVYAGTGEAVEGDVLAIGRTRFLLYGIDTVEPGQLCSINGEVWECWPAVLRGLQTVLSEGEVRCTPIGGGDPFGRVLALCEVNGESVNRRLVQMGFAIAVPEEMPEYLAVEEEARAQQIGLWQGAFMSPEEWRAARGILMRRP
jgi:endonuclease YncB( thermonuclease family)